jgi:hypothetical protein
MTRALRLFLLLVVLPLGLVASVGSVLVARSSESALFDARARMGGAAARMFRQDMAELAQALAEDAGPIANPDLESPAIQAALRGDTVAALGSAGETLQLTVIIADEIEPPRTGHPLGSARIRSDAIPFQPSFLQTLERNTGYRSAVYFRGKRTAVSRDGFGPETLSESQLARLGSEPEGSSIRWAEGEGVLVAVTGAPEAAATVAVLVAPSGTAEFTWGNRALIATQVATLIVVLLVGWLILGRGPCEAVSAWPPARGGLIASVILALILLGWVWTVLAQMESTTREDVQELTSRELVRALSVAKADPARFSVTFTNEAWGFDATRVRDGQVEASSVETEADGLLLLPTPPPSFPISGEVSLGQEDHLYAGAGLSDGSVLFVTLPTSGEALGNLRFLLLVLGLAGVVPVSLYLARVISALRHHQP